MIRDNYINLDRTFYLLPEPPSTDELEQEFESSLPLFEKGVTWEGLVKEPRVVILSEAGSGKSSEVYQAATRLRYQTHLSFLLRIEDIVDNVDGFDVGTNEEFDKWLNGNEIAWIFLDSVDEAKLSDPRDFSKAIRRFSKRIEVGLSRAFIFITSRASAWSYKSDLDLCNRYLPNPTAKDYDLLKNFFKVYSLTDLDTRQVEKFLRANDITDVDKFLAETAKQEARMFTSRPQDLVELINYWKRHGLIASKYQLIQDSIEWRLTEADETRAHIQSMSKEKLRVGVEKIAVAMILMKKFTAGITDGTNPTIGINLKSVLSDWSDRDCATLLSRPIFDDALYGSVRFHHRSVREYLAAKWFFNRLNDGSPRFPIENLFFKSQYGLKVIVPSMRHILPWLAQMDEKVRQRVMEIEPYAILEGGDPATFPRHIREQLLERVCENADKKASNWHFNNWESVKKLAKSDISTKVTFLLDRYTCNSTIVSLLFDTARSGEISECLPQAKILAVSTELDNHARIAAVKAVRHFGNQEDIRSIRDYYSSYVSEIDRSLATELITGLKGEKGDIDWLFDTLRLVSNADDYRMSGLSNQLIEFISKLDLNSVSDVGKRCAIILSQEPYLESGYCRISKLNSWLFDIALYAIERLLLNKSSLAFESVFANLILQIHPIRHYHVIKRNNQVMSLASKWLEYKHYLYWKNVETRRSELAKRNITLWSCHQVHFNDPEILFNVEDLDRLFKTIFDEQNRDNRLVALTLSVKIYQENGKPRHLLAQIKRLVAHDEEMKTILNNFLHPPKLSKEERSALARSSSYRAGQMVREKKDALFFRDTVAKIKANPDQLRNHHLGRGKVSQFQYFLYEQTSSKDDGDSNSFIRTNWRVLLPIVGQEAALAYRDGIMSFWRQHEPIWSTENGDIELDIFLFFALSGLQIEASEVGAWHEKLTTQETVLACKYAFAKLNEFPNWFVDIIKVSPRLVVELIFKEMDREALFNSKSSTIVLRIFYHHKELWSKLADGLMARLRDSDGKMRDIEYAIKIVESIEKICDRNLSDLASFKCNTTPSSENLPLWYATWVGVDPDPALKALKRLLENMEPSAEAQQFAMRFVCSLMGTRGSGGEPRQNFKNPKSLGDLIVLMYSYIKREDDIERAGRGVYSPGLRDDAQDARNRLERYLMDISGKESFLTLAELAESHPYVPYRKWMLNDARERATIDSAFDPYPENAFQEFCATLERTPTNHSELYELAVLRFFDLKADLEDGDNSFAFNLIDEQKETRVRNVIGGWCRDRAINRYSIVQEEELADAKKPDLRFIGKTFDAPVPVELKLANKWTACELLERLENQLCGDYLRDKRSSYGIFLLINQSKGGWASGDRQLSFDELVGELEVRWEEISKHYPDIIGVKVIGINLLKRSV